MSPKNSRAVLLLLTIAALGSPVALGQRPKKPSNLTNYFAGNTVRNVNQPVGGPAILLMGGGSEVDRAFTMYGYPIANGGDFVVLRASGSDGYQDYLYTQLVNQLPADQRPLLQPNSVETLVVNTRSKAQTDYVKWVVEGANLIFIAGGNQSDYLAQWKGTSLETALRTAYQRGAVIGGLSAGACVMGDFIYDPGSSSAVTSNTAIANPYHSSITLSNNFTNFEIMRQTYVETHFAERDRMGRTLAFLARLRQDESLESPIGLANDEGVALFIDASGLATMQRQHSTGSAYVLQGSRRSTRRIQVAAGVPLVVEHVLRTRLQPGNTFHLKSGATSGVTIPLSVDGRNPTVFNPASPY